ncbi:MAG: YihY/virulence factor BrkB family protein [Bacilli bacterium]
MKSIKKRIVALKDRLIYNIKRPEIRVLPGQLAFFFLMTLIPLVSLLGVLISLLDLPYSSISEVLNNYFPDGTASLLSAITTTPNLNANVIIFFASAILLASNGPHSMIVTSNQIYKIKDRNYVIRRGKALLMTVVVVVLLIFVLLIPVFGDMIFKMIATIDGASTIKNFILSAYKILKYPFSFVFMYFMIKMLYIMAPDKRIERKNVVYGSLFTTISWILVTQVYSVYVEKFSNYTTLYGSMASILILMLWLYLISYIFVLGMALNVTKYELAKGNEENLVENK